MFRATLLVVLALISLGSGFVDVRISSPEKYLIDVVFQNTREQTVFMLSWNSPFDFLTGGTAFDVQQNGESVQYIGALAKRGKDRKSYIELPSGKDVRVTFDLSSAYDFSNGGSYNVQLNMETLEVVLHTNILGDAEMVNIKSNILEVEYPSFSVQNIQQLINETLEAISYVSCTASEQTTVKKAWDYFLVMIAAMNNYMVNNQQTATYTTFFGSTSYWSTVANIISKEKTAGTGNVKFNCDPPSCGSSSTYAYVYPTDTSRTIYLCGAFWTSKLSGYDSQQGVIVHELSHFSNIGGTQDYAYGVTAAKNLAKTSPAKAVANADNYEYYGETVPVLSKF